MISRLKSEPSTPAVILPFYGEFGWFLTSYVRLAHYLQCPRKVVCCRRGDEVFFPSAAGFFYDWADIFTDPQRCGFRNEWPIRPVTSLTPEERQLEKKLRTAFPDHQQIRFEHPLPPELVPYFPIEIKPPGRLPIRVDVVICARRRFPTGISSDRGERNFPRWQEIIDPLVAAGYSVGLIGRRETSTPLAGAVVASWDFARCTDAMVQLLLNARLYIGTDTGPTHLAALLKTPMVVFRNTRETVSPNMISASVLPLAVLGGFPAQVIAGGWDFPEKVVAAALHFLEQPCIPYARRKR